MSAIEPHSRGPFALEILARCPRTRARAGRVRTPHGSAETPAFMPVGTAATVKGVEPGLLRESGSEIVLCNTYHLALRPGSEVVRDLGGLHRFMGWDGPILTDSGGYQVFSLADLTEIDADGVTFKSHLDGSVLRLTPERAMEIQLDLGADIVMVLDECLPKEADRDSARRSIETRTLPWSERCLALRPRDGRAVFGIGQGGVFEDLRIGHARALAALPFDGFAIGGLSVGETGPEFRRMIEVTTEILPEDRCRYLMGVGSLPEILDAIALGVDLFDCVLPTRNARNGQAFTAEGPFHMRNARWTRDPSPIEAGCPCPACARGLSRAYLRHLFQAGEMLGPILLTLHNLRFMQRLMSGARAAIAAGTFDAWRTERIAAWKQGTPIVLE